MPLRLAPALERYIADKVKSAAYRAAADLISGAVLHLQAQENEDPVWVETLRFRANEAIKDIESGRKGSWDVETLKARLLDGCM